MTEKKKVEKPQRTPQEDSPESHVEETHREETRKKMELRKAAQLVAGDIHGNDDDIIKLKKNVDAADSAVKQFQQDLRALQMDAQYARVQFEKALEKHIEPRYQLSDAEWRKVEARFRRNVR